MRSHRIVVMNGQRVVQVEGQSPSSDEWKTVSVGKAGDLKPGVYQLGDVAGLIGDRDRQAIERCIVSEAVEASS